MQTIKTLQAIIQFTRSKEWAMTVSIITAVVAAIPEWANLVDGEINAGATWPSIVILLGGAIIRSNVWARASVPV